MLLIRAILVICLIYMGIQITHAKDTSKAPVYVGQGRYVCEGKSAGCQRFEAEQRGRNDREQRFRETERQIESMERSR